MEFSHSQLKTLLTDAHRILLTGPESADVDTLATALAWSIFLTKEKKDFDLVFANTKDKLNFVKLERVLENNLQPQGKFQILLDINKTKVKQLSYDIKEDKLVIDIVPEQGVFTDQDVSSKNTNYLYDLILVFGASNLNALGENFLQHTEFFYQTKIINIDRSLTNENFGALNIVDTTVTSFGEMSYEFLKENLDKDMATLLLTSMIAATNSFQSAQVKPQTLEIASALLVAGADRPKIIEFLYRTKDIATLKTWGKVLARLQKKAGILFSYLEHQEKNHLPEDFLDLIKNLILTTPQTDLAIIFYQLDFETTEVWLYSKPNINALDLSREWTGLGDKNFAKFLLNNNLKDSQEIVLGELANKLNLINRV